MRRVLLVLAVVAAMVATMMALAGPAAFAEDNPFTQNPGQFTATTGDPALCRPLFARDLSDVSGTNSENGIDFVSGRPPTVEGPAGTNAC